MSRQFTRDFMLEVAKGKIEGHTQMNKYGHNPDIDTGTVPEDVWGGGGVYTFYFTTNQSVSAVSTSANDSGTTVSSGTATGGSVTTLIDTGADFVSDGVAVGDAIINDTNGEVATINAVAATTLTHTPMSNYSSVSPSSNPNESGDTYRIGSANSTGAGVVHIEGLSNSSGTWSVTTETVIMNGTSDVALQNGYVRMYRAFALETGSNEANVGNITVDVDGTGEVGIYINADDAQTQQAIFTIPSNMTGYFIKGYVGIGSGVSAATAANAVFTWRARLNNGSTGAFAIKGQIEVISNGMPYWIYEYGVPVALPEKTDVLIRCEDVSSSNMAVVGAFDLVLVENE